MRTIADYLMQTLRLAGADVLFGYPGQSNLALLHAAGRADLRYVQTADERGAGFAAMGYALSTDKPGVVCASKGPGATNLLTPLLSAMKDGVPLIVITGNVARRCRGRNGFQEFDVCTALLAAGAVKSARYCETPEQVADALVSAITAAATRPCGPVLIDLPYDILTDPCPIGPERIDAHPRAAEPPDAGQAAAIDAAVERLLAAERPLLIVGAGARRDHQLVRPFATACGGPVVHTMGGTGVIPTAHPLYAGLLRHNGSRQAARLVHEADTLLALGTGLDERATGERTQFARGALKIQVDIDERVLRRNQFVDIGIHSSIRAFLERATPRLRARRGASRWAADLSTAAAAADHARPGSLLSAQDVVRAAADALTPAIVIKDSGSHKYWMTNLAPCADPSQSIASCHFGAMGFALPAAIGASIGNPERSVIVACGDGGLLMSLPDLITCVRESCGNLKILVFNNAGLGSTRDYERRTHAAPPGDAYISDFGTWLSFAAYARAMGLASHTIATPADLEALAPLLRAPGLALLDCHIDPQETQSPSVPYLGPLARLADSCPAVVVT